MAYDISMTSKDQVLALLNQSAGLSLTWEQVEFDVPAINTNPTYERNTELVISGIPDFGYKGSASIYYNRIDLSEFVAIARNPFVVQVDVDPDTGTLTLQDILDGFNAYFGSALVIEDIADSYVLPTNWADGESFTMEASAWSYAYRGNVSFVVRPLDVDIDVAVENKLLDGLVLTEPTP